MKLPIVGLCHDKDTPSRTHSKLLQFVVPQRTIMFRHRLQRPTFYMDIFYIYRYSNTIVRNILLTKCVWFIYLIDIHHYGNIYIYL